MKRSITIISANYSLIEFLIIFAKTSRIRKTPENTEVWEPAPTTMAVELKKISGFKGIINLGAMSDAVKADMQLSEQLNTVNRMTPWRVHKARCM